MGCCASRDAEEVDGDEDEWDDVDELQSQPDEDEPAERSANVAEGIANQYERTQHSHPPSHSTTKQFPSRALTFLPQSTPPSSSNSGSTDEPQLAVLASTQTKEEQPRAKSMVQFDDSAWDSRRRTQSTNFMMASMASSRRWEEVEEAAIVEPARVQLPANGLSPKAQKPRPKFMLAKDYFKNITTTNPLAGPTGQHPSDAIPDAIPIDLLARDATAKQRSAWSAEFSNLLSPVMAKLTHAGRRNVESWLTEVGGQPDIVPSLVSPSANDTQPSLTRRTLNSNDRIIRTLNERRRGSSVTSSQDGDNEEARRRSSTRIRSRQLRPDDEDDFIADYNELQVQAAISSDGDNSSRHTVRSAADGLRTAVSGAEPNS